jgi:hypothetical protein
MTKMHNFSTALAAYFAGPPKRSQQDFSRASRINRSKLCRLIYNQISCDRDTLDQVLSAVREDDKRRDLVYAYIRDCASPGALLHLKRNQADEWEGFDFHPLSVKGQTALKAILTGPSARAFEKMLFTLSEALAAQH